MAENDQVLLLWWGKDALDWEIDYWKLLRSSKSFAQSTFLEIYTQEEMDEVIERLQQEGWKIGHNGSGAAWRISACTRES